jgi:hypothetical protein
VTIDQLLARLPTGWDWCLYSASAPSYQSRAVLMSADRRVQISREADTVQAALALAVKALAPEALR